MFCRVIIHFYSAITARFIAASYYAFCTTAFGITKDFSLRYKYFMVLKFSHVPALLCMITCKIRHMFTETRSLIYNLAGFALCKHDIKKCIPELYLHLLWRSSSQAIDKDLMKLFWAEKDSQERKTMCTFFCGHLHILHWYLCNFLIQYYSALLCFWIIFWLIWHMTVFHSFVMY